MSVINGNEINYEFGETSIPSQYTCVLAENFGYLWVDNRTPDVYKLIFSTFADYLKVLEDKSKKRSGFKFKDSNGNFKIGAILSYHEPDADSEDDAGNWYLEMTFNEDDMTDLDAEYDNHSDMYVRCLGRMLGEIFHGRIKTVEAMDNMTTAAIDCLTTFLDVNATPGKKVSVELKGYFVASVEFDEGEKFMSITPGECVKQLIKDDAGL